jgi:phage N-6-adenine-methyltransferase
VSKEEFKTIHGNDFSTPDWLFQTLHKEFNFQYDLAANASNKKLDKALIEGEVDALSVNWRDLSDGWLWSNPPYSPLKPWIEKAQLENNRGAKIVMLVPPIITSTYFSAHLPSEIRFIVGRVNFFRGGEEIKGNTRDSCLLIFDTKIRQPKIVYIKRDDLK